MVVGRPCKLGHTVRYIATNRCVECELATKAAYRHANPAKFRAYKKAYQKNNPDGRRAWAAAYRKAHPEKMRARFAAWCAANRGLKRAYNAAWKRANPAGVAAQCARRKARKMAAPGRGVTVDQCREILAESLGICAYCNERRPLTMDHIEPLARGGAHDIDNIAAVCGTCNSSKGDSGLLVWLASRRLGEPPLRQTQSKAAKATLGQQRGVSVPLEAMAAA